jgi:uncharacterized protein YjbI with pentapeptide repeats
MRFSNQLSALLLTVCVAGTVQAAEMTRAQVEQLLAKADKQHPAPLRRKDLTDLDLSGLDFRNADLWGADLRRANFSHTNLAGMNLDLTVMTNINVKLRQAKAAQSTQTY